MRRRPFSSRRPLRASRLPSDPAAPPIPVPPMIQAALQEAQRLLPAAPFQAALIYETLAHEAYTHERWRPGLHMDLAAARAFLEANELDYAQRSARRALRYALQLARPALVFSLFNEIADQFEAHGDAAGAQRFRDEFDALVRERRGDITELPLAPEAVPVLYQRRRALPAKCPACAAPIYPDEVEWLAEDRVVCSFCGSVVVA